MKILLTSGGTKVKIDRVRHIGNMSSGTFGAKIALELLKMMSPWEDNLLFLRSDGSKSPFAMNINWADSVLPLGKTSEASSDSDLIDLLQLRLIHDNWRLYHHRNAYVERVYKNFDDYQRLLQWWISSYDVIVLAAAVSDYVVKNYVDGKIRSTGDLNIELEPAPKIISRIKEWNPNAKLVGFKLLVDSTDEQLIAAARESINKNGCDLVVANDLRDIAAGKHRVMLVEKDGIAIYPTGIAHQVTTGPNHLAEIVSSRIIKLALGNSE